MRLPSSPQKLSLPAPSLKELPSATAAAAAPAPVWRRASALRRSASPEAATGMDASVWTPAFARFNRQYACYASSCRYLPPREVCALATERRTGRAFAMLGHNRKSCPEIYTCDPGRCWCETQALGRHGFGPGSSREWCPFLTPLPCCRLLVHPCPFCPLFPHRFLSSHVPLALV